MATVLKTKANKRLEADAVKRRSVSCCCCGPPLKLAFSVRFEVNHDVGVNDSSGSGTDFSTSGRIPATLGHSS